jgi:hypothetical protein
MLRVAFMLCLLSGIARAGVGVVTAGEPTAQGPVDQLVKAWLHEHGFEVDELVGDVKTSFVNCFVLEDLACARGVFEARSPSTHLVHVQIHLELGDGPNYTLTSYWFVKGHDPVVDKRRCERCDPAALGAVVNEMMRTLAGASTNASNKGRVKITARSPGVIVWIDNVKHGVAPLERDLAPGRHEISFADRGRILGTQNILVDAGSVVEVSSPELGQRPFPLVPALLVGGGVATCLAGGVFLYYGSLGGPDERYVYDNATEIGVATTLVGGAAVVAGAVLWVRGRNRATPTVSASATRVQLNWGWTF